MKTGWKNLAFGVLAAAMLLVAVPTAQAQTCDPGDVIISADITTSQTWTSDNTYCLSDVIYVTNGATLTIAPGTVIRAEPDETATNKPGTLVISRGSKIRALGTKGSPIIMTDLDDSNVPGMVPAFPYEFPEDAIGQTGNWGGLILLGRGWVAKDTGAGPDPAREVQIEGSVSLMDLKEKTIHGHYGYHGDGWLTIHLEEYL